jgi:hypothetical protein
MSLYWERYCVRLSGELGLSVCNKLDSLKNALPLGRKPRCCQLFVKNHPDPSIYGLVEFEKSQGGIDRSCRYPSMSKRVPDLDQCQSISQRPRFFISELNL